VVEKNPIPELSRDALYCGRASEGQEMGVIVRQRLKTPVKEFEGRS
jgi:hypothetical protein